MASSVRLLRLLPPLALACLDSKPDSGTLVGPRQASLPRAEATRVYQALAESLHNSGFDSPWVFDRSVLPLTELREDTTPRAHEPWVVNALLSSKRFSGACYRDCKQGRPTMVFEVSVLHNVVGTDTMVVAVGQYSTPPLPGFGAYDWYYLAKVQGRWAVVKIDWKVIS